MRVTVSTLKTSRFRPPASRFRPPTHFCMGSKLWRGWQSIEVTLVMLGVKTVTFWVKTVTLPKNTLLHGVKTVTRMAVNWRHFSHGAHWLGVKTVTFLQVAILLWNFGHNMGSKLWRGWQSTEVTLVMVSIDWESKPWRFGWVTVWDSSGRSLNATIRARKGGQNCDAHEKKLLTCIRASKGSQNRVALFFDLYVAGALLTPTPIATKYSCD